MKKLTVDNMELHYSTGHRTTRFYTLQKVMRKALIFFGNYKEITEYTHVGDLDINIECNYITKDVIKKSILNDIIKPYKRRMEIENGEIV